MINFYQLKNKNCDKKISLFTFHFSENENSMSYNLLLNYGDIKFLLNL